MKNRKQIQKLENRNAELAKEILLNETAVYESEKEIKMITTDLLEHPKIQQYVNNIKLLIERIEEKNQEYKDEIFENDLEISRLKDEDDGKE